MTSRRSPNRSRSSVRRPTCHVEDAATALGQLQNVIGLTGDEFDNFAATLVDLGNKGAQHRGANPRDRQACRVARRSHRHRQGRDAWLGIGRGQPRTQRGAGRHRAVQNSSSVPRRSSARGGEDLKTLAKITGQTAKQFKRLRKDATGALRLHQGPKGLSEGSACSPSRRCTARARADQDPARSVRRWTILTDVHR